MGTSTTPTQTISSTAQDFLALALHRKPTPKPSSFPRETTHYLYLKPHTPRIPTLDTSRQLFLVNVPVDATESSIKSLFAEQVGGARVEGVRFDGWVEKKKKNKKTQGILVVVMGEEGRGKKRKRRELETGDGEREGDGEGEGAVEVGSLPETWDREVHVSGSSAVVTFVDEASRELALKAARRISRKGPKSEGVIAWGGGENGRDGAPLGAKRYLAHHRLRYPDHAALQKCVDEYMSAFNAQEAARSKELARRRAEPDEDGFVTVTRGGRNGPAREEDAKLKAEELKEREQKRVGGDFYRFQNREKRKEVARDLVKEFERDRERVEEMRRRKGRVVPEK